ncbi:substrate-binding domain-containing protein [Bacillus pumilus]|uniref:substrate-binding domain-containing protein n=1 Tax=Bacillus pumilus TaxID=1408 RepID=UPI003B75B9BF
MKCQSVGTISNCGWTPTAPPVPIAIPWGDWLNAHPNGGISGIIAQNDDMALGALQAVKSRGLTPTEVPVTSIDGMPDAIQAAKRNEITTFLQDAQAQSQGALDVALRALAGKTTSRAP